MINLFHNYELIFFDSWNIFYLKLNWDINITSLAFFFLFIWEIFLILAISIFSSLRVLLYLSCKHHVDRFLKSVWKHFERWTIMYTHKSLMCLDLNYHVLYSVCSNCFISFLFIAFFYISYFYHALFCFSSSLVIIVLFLFF